MDISKINTLGKLKKSGYTHKTVKEELRRNLIKRLQQKEATFPGIIGYEDTVIPETERALLLPPQYPSWVCAARQRPAWPGR